MSCRRGSGVKLRWQHLQVPPQEAVNGRGKVIGRWTVYNCSYIFVPLDPGKKVGGGGGGGGGGDSLMWPYKFIYMLPYRVWCCAFGIMILVGSLDRVPLKSKLTKIIVHKRTAMYL